MYRMTCILHISYAWENQFEPPAATATQHVTLGRPAETTNRELLFYVVSGPPAAPAAHHVVDRPAETASRELLLYVVSGPPGSI